MKKIRKITGFMAVSLFFLIGFCPFVSAQSPKIGSSLDDIKARLQEEGIEVLDYSTPENAWGSLPSEWISVLSKDYENLAELAAEFETDYIGEGSLNDFRRQLAIAGAEKSRLTQRSEIEEKDLEIQELEKEIERLETVIKLKIEGEISEVENLDKTAGMNLIFAEIDFYYNYQKWGRLPLRLIGILELDTEYESLQDMIDANSLDNQEAAEREAGLELLTEELSAIQDLSADDVELILESTILTTTSGEVQISQIGRTVANAIKNIAGALAALWIVISGVRMIFAQGDENVITEQKRSLLYGVIGLVAILLMDRMIDVIYGPAGEIRTELTPDQGFSNEVYGIITFIKTLVGTIAILFIVINGVRTLFAQGEEDKITKQRKAILWIGVGLILMAIDEVIVDNVFIIPTQQNDEIRSSNIVAIVNTMGNVLQFILGFVGLITFGILIYGAATMVMNYGNDDMVEKAKKIIRNAIIGVLVILSAYVIVATLVVFK